MAAMPHREFCITIGMSREMSLQSAGEEKEIERKKKKNIRLKSGGAEWGDDNIYA